MSMKNGPGWLGDLQTWFGWAQGMGIVVSASLVGVMAKIAESIKEGDRRKFWTWSLFLEVPGLGVTVLISWSIVNHFDLSPFAAVGISSILGWAGPKTIERLAIQVFNRWNRS